MVSTDGLSPPAPAPDGDSFADRLNRLFAIVHPSDRKPYNNREVAEAITAAGEQMSQQYVWALRNGTRANPTLRQIEALARFFGVPTSYLVSGERASTIDEQLRLLVAARDDNVREILARSSDLTGPDRTAVLRIITGLIAETRSRDDSHGSSGGDL